MAIPEKGKLIKLKVLQKTHEDYAKEAARLRMLHDTYTGAGGYQTPTVRYNSDTKAAEASPGRKTYLQPHDSEEASDFKSRVERAFYPNFARKRVIQPLVGFLTKRNPSRNDEYPDALTSWMEDATPDGQNWDLLLKEEVLPLGMVFGRLYVVFDSDPSDAETEAQRQEAGARVAVASAIWPIAVLDRHYDENRKLRWLKTKQRVDTTADPLAVKATFVERYRWYTEEGWFYVDVPLDEQQQKDEYPVTERGEWASQLGGRLPIAEFRLGPDGLSVLEDIVGVQRRIYNSLSEQNDLFRQQTFSTLMMPAKKVKALEKVKLGAKRGMIFDPQGKHKPYYLSPERGPLDQYMQEIAHLERMIIELANLDFSGGQATAAAAKAFQFQGTDRLLSDLAGDVTRFEYEAMDIVARWHGEEFPAEAGVTYPDTFDAVDVERLLNAAGLAIQAELGPTFDKLMKMRMVAVLLPNASDVERAKILEEIGAMPERDPADDAPPDPGGGFGEDGEKVRDTAPSPLRVPPSFTR